MAELFTEQHSWRSQGWQVMKRSHFAHPDQIQYNY